jgi:glycosyltransferase involved in cell wall biosynthesis
VQALEPATQPVISVVMTSYADPLPRLKRAIDSILEQDFRDLELLLAFEPGDKNADILGQDYTDPRLVILRNPTPSGKSGSFNHCLQRARGRYIARMDSDDRALPHRFRDQLAFMAANPDVGVLGGGTIIIDEAGRQIATRLFPAGHREIVRRFTLTCAVSHPTILWDRKKLGADIRYDPDFSVEDLELWFRLLSRGHRFANFQSYVIEYKQTNEWRRPQRAWRGNARVRLVYWRLVLRYPELFFGMIIFSLLAIMPNAVVNRITGRNWFSDSLRAIRASDIRSSTP